MTWPRQGCWERPIPQSSMWPRTIINKPRKKLSKPTFLVFWDQRVVKIHDIGLLLDQVMTIEPVFETWRDAADRLTPLATLYRYPGLSDDPLPSELEEALDDATTIVGQVLALLPENVHPVAEDS